MKEVARGEKESFQDFLNKVIKENCNQTSKNGNENTRQYYILYWQDKKNAIKPILQHSGVIVEKTEGAMQWLQKIEPWIEIMSHSFSDHEESGARSLISSISLYLSRTTTQVEPFEWWRLSA